jgi:hypothetical protein
LVLNKDKMDEKLCISFRIINVIDTGIYECEPIGDNSYSYPIWIVCTFDFTKLKNEDLSDLELHKIPKKEQYISNISKEGKNKAIFVIPKTVFIKLSENDYDSLGYFTPSGEFTDNEYKPFAAKEIREEVKEYEKTNTTPTKATRVRDVPPLLRNKRPPRDPSPEPGGHLKNDYDDKKIRDNLKKMMNDMRIAASYDLTQPITPQIASPFKKKKSLKKKKSKSKNSLKKKKSKSKNSLKKKKSKSKNSLKK